MIVGINARILNTNSIRGWSRYTCNLIHGLHNNGIDIRLFSDQPINLQLIPQELHKHVHVESGTSYIHWEQIVLKKMSEKHDVNILHCPINYGLPFFGKFKKILTLHDAIEKSFYRKLMSPLGKIQFTHLKMNTFYWASQKSADKIITVSKFAKKDIVENYKIPPEDISVIYEAADNLFSSDNIKSEVEFVARWKVSPGYLLYIGGFEERKNIDFLLKMAKKLPQRQFVLVGGGDIDRFSSIPSNVHFTGYVDECWLPSFYNYSKAFVYPSFHEGFGLQLVESMALNRPCLYADVTSLPEIYGSREWAFDPYNVDQAIEKLNHLENNYDKAINYVKTRKESFSWNKTVKETIDLYRSLC